VQQDANSPINRRFQNVATVAKLFKRPEDADKALADLKGMGLSPAVVQKGADLDKELANTGLPDQALDYYKIGVAVGGKIVKVDVDDAKVNEVNTLLVSTGFDELTERPAQWFTSPGFAKAPRMAATNPIDAKMSGDFRKY